MKKLDLGQTINTLANVGVIAGIVFLAIELSQNNRLLEAQARSERESVRRSAFTRYIENPDLARARVKERNGEPLTDLEAALIGWSNGWTIADWRYIHGEYSEGLLDENALPVDGWRQVIENSPSLADRWRNTEEARSDSEFARFMEKIVSD